MVEKLTVQDALDGADQVVSAFALIEQGAAAAIGNIAKMAKLGAVGVRPGGRTGRRRGGFLCRFALALERLTVSASEFAADICGLAVISGISAEEMSTLTMAFSAAGVSSGEMQTSLRRFAQTVTTDLAKVRQEMAGVGDTSATSAIRVKEATNALNKVMGEFITYNEKDLAIQKARVALSEAQHTAAQGQAKDIRRALGYFDDLAKGVKTSTDGMNLSLENLKKGLIASLGEGVEKLNDFTGSLRASAIPVRSRCCSSLPTSSTTCRTAFRRRRSRRSYSAAAWDRISLHFSVRARLQSKRRGSGSLIGFTLNDTEQGALKRFRIANFELADTLDRLKEKFSAAVSPAFTKALEDANHSSRSTPTTSSIWAR